MKLRTALVLSLLAVLLVMAVPALFGLAQLRAIRVTALDVRSRTAEAAFSVGQVRAGLERLDRLQRGYIATGDPELAERSRYAADALRADLDQLRRMGYGDVLDSAHVPARALGSVATLTTTLMEAGHREAATDLLRRGLAPLMEEAVVATARLAEGVDAVTAAEVGRVDHLTRRAATATAAALFGALLIAGALSLLAARSLTRPLEQLRGSMARVADGHFDPPTGLPYERKDEVGELLRAFRSMALQLSDLDRVKAEFVSIASHDMKTPVNVINGYAELLSEELGPTLDARQIELLEALRRQTRTLSARANQLLQLSRIQAAGMRLGLEEINIRHLAAALAESHGALGRRHRIEIVTHVDETAPTFLIADPDCLRTEVLGYLLDNAVKFTPRGGQVELRVSGAGGVATFEVIDQGPPIPPEVLPHLFDRYYRGRDVSGRVGAGLGMPIARAGAEAHGGSMEVESSAEGGTVFRVKLPVHPTLASGPAPLEPQTV